MKFVDLSIPQGEDWSVSLDFVNDDNTPVNLTGYSFISAFRTSYPAQNNSGNLTMTIVNAAAGNTILSMNSAVSSNTTADKYVYDVYMIDPFGNQTRVMEGLLILTPGVTIR